MGGDNPIAMGMHQARTYWSFLFAGGLLEDIRQEIELAVLISNPQTRGKREFALAVNRGLYSLAVANGWRKRPAYQGPNLKGQWWERRALSFEEMGGNSTIERVESGRQLRRKQLRRHKA